MRIDRLLCYLRFARSRSLAADIVCGGTVRCNGNRVLRPSLPIAAGDVLTFPIGNTVRVIEVTALPERRSSAMVAQTLYRDLASGGPGPDAGPDAGEPNKSGT